VRSPPVVRLAQPFQRARRIAPLNARVDEHIGQLKIPSESARIDLTCNNRDSC
jgi:hypothetical protein